MRGQLLAEGLDFFLAPAPVLVPAIQTSLEHKSPTRLSRPSGLPLQAANQLVEFMAGKHTGLDCQSYGIWAPNIRRPQSVYSSHGDTSAVGRCRETPIPIDLS
jgi:hypothetical protein